MQQAVMPTIVLSAAVMKLFLTGLFCLS